MDTDDERPTRARQTLVESLRERGHIYTTRVAKAMAAVPRHEFVPDAVRDHAYADEPLDIGHGQVVTAPHLVAQMTELLELRPGQTVLEVGTGSGYHAAVLAEMVGPENVFTIERIPELADAARAALERTGYGDVTVVVADGSGGLPDHAPFDRINVTSVAPDVPGPLVDQLADDGRMVIPLGPRGGSHELVLLTKQDGRIERTNYGGVRFVPLVGAYGFAEEE
ncbi:protein-L-isoaspartate(D-aspartate) O-methyltransferase [Haloferax profundi]|uniref:Protein-L-isoaspartate O-methyltransferase n=1 Tax=Haloferax profundi TaxID=1544718 RepID=A0A0W1SNW3_9EURY|nr:protein-L-isoaspartate(D-aspartate) O-methyltransferase [Haloferax profundi]KTG27982.1 protein-L-isoaspartate O-methyltransferase [Haloferax profundi]